MSRPDDLSPADGGAPASHVATSGRPASTSHACAARSGPAAGPAELPFIDAYSIEAKAPPEQVWEVIVGRVLPRFGGGFGPVATGRIGQLGARVLRAPYAPPGPAGAGAGASPGTGPSPPSVITGFRLERAERPELIALAGEHRFARYSLTLRVGPGASGSVSRLSAETRAAFRGTPGRLYRTAVIGTGAHRLVVSRLLYRIRRLAQRP